MIISITITTIAMTIGVVFLLVVWRLDALAVEDGLVAVDQRRLGSQVGRRLGNDRNGGVVRVGCEVAALLPLLNAGDAQ